MKKLTFLLIVSLLAVSGLNAQQIDHVTIVYKDLELAKKKYKELGFSIKHSTLHKNGIINAFVKFRDISYLEFMSVTELPIGKMAKTYEKFLEKGDGGVYLVLSGIETDELKSKLKDAEIKFTIDRNQSWDYILLKDKELEHIYFINYHIKINDTEEHLTHKNSTHGIKELWVEGNEKVVAVEKILDPEDETIVSDE